MSEKTCRPHGFFSCYAFGSVQQEKWGGSFTLFTPVAMPENSILAPMGLNSPFGA
ncbi:hypothetical protein [Serratia plymuthica]